MADIQRLSLFIDFWNFQLSLRDYDPSLRIDWFSIPKVFTKLTESSLAKSSDSSSVRYESCYIIGSCGPNDQALGNWARKTLSKINGCKTIFLDRQKQKGAYICTGPFHHEITDCPECGSSLFGYKEKGVDTTIVTTLLREAWENLYDIALIVSSDRDFIPAIETLYHLKKKSIVAHPRNKGHDLASKAWADILIEDFCEDLRRA
jgi:uncharacterized LabA/DUF88 family protein